MGTTNVDTGTQTNLLLNFNISSLRIYATNSFTLTNITGLESGEGVNELNLTMEVIVCTNSYISITYSSAYGIH